jgi:hypothetical protein
MRWDTIADQVDLVDGSFDKDLAAAKLKETNAAKEKLLLRSANP